MMSRAGYRTWLLRFLAGTRKAGSGGLLWFSVAASVSLYGQINPDASQASSIDVAHETQASVVKPLAPESSITEENPAFALQPAWAVTSDSDGNVRQRIKLNSDFAVGDHARIGIYLAQGVVSNSLQALRTEEIRDFAFTSQWHPAPSFQFDGMVGVSQVAVTRDADDRGVGRSLIPIAKLMGHLKTPENVFKLDCGFERSIFDLSPLLVANRVVRNQFTIRPALAFLDGWRIRALSEVGSITTATEGNARYSTEFTVGHKLGKASEVYSTYNALHYAHASSAGYFPPDLVHNLQGGWTTDIDRGPVSLTLDMAMGTGRSREHGAGFGPWGISAYAGSYLTWTIRDRSELTASYEYSYDQSSPPLEPTPSGGWRMHAVTLSFRWATK